MNINYKTDFNPKDSVEEIFKKVLEARGLKNPKTIQTFLNPPEPTLELLQKELKIKTPDLNQFKKVIKKSIKEKQDICIYGDYDADGITSTAILWNTLNKIGARSLPFIPHREKHGYGLSKSALKEILSGEAFKNSSLQPFEPEIFITTDNGIVANEEIKFLKDKGKTVILTDHHQKDKTTPPADVIIHSTESSAAAISWLISLFLTGESKFSKELIDLATIGIVADQIPLTNINRTIAVHGLKKLSSTKHVGLQELYRLSGISDKQLSTYDIGFIIGPRINAMGRIRHGLESLRLLCTKDEKSAHKLAKVLESTNKSRQNMTDKALKKAKDNLTDNKLLVVASDAYHEGIVGLIAGKLLEETGKPSLAISIGKDLAKGSARSIKGVNITDLLRTQQELLESVGGHKLAAGFSLKPENLDKFTKEIQELANQKISDELLTRSLTIEGELNFNQITKKLYNKLTQLSPFGLGNPRPRFITKNFKILESRRVGQSGNHLKLLFSQGSSNMQAIWFNANTKPPQELSEIIYTIDLNVWRNQENLQLIVKYAN